MRREIHLVQDGPKERLLCHECEQRISRYEKYFKEAIHLSRHGIEIVQAGGEAIIQNLDYRRVKLFLLSILWRMSVSSLPQCQMVALGEAEEVIRRRVLQGDPGESQEFAVSGAILLINGKMEESVLCTPFVSTQNNAYALVVGGILYFVSIGESPAVLGPRYLLNESGDWIMPVVDFDKISFLGAFLTRNSGTECSIEGASEEGM